MKKSKLRKIIRQILKEQPTDGYPIVGNFLNSFIATDTNPTGCFGFTPITVASNVPTSGYDTFTQMLEVGPNIPIGQFGFTTTSPINVTNNQCREGTNGGGYGKYVEVNGNWRARKFFNQDTGPGPNGSYGNVTVAEGPTSLDLTPQEILNEVISQVGNDYDSISFAGQSASGVVCRCIGEEANYENWGCEEYDVLSSADQSMFCFGCFQGDIPANMSQVCDCCPEPNPHRCNLGGQCVPDSDGPFYTLQMCEDAGCFPPVTQQDYPGCTDENANNYNPDANINDGSCTYDPIGPNTGPDDLIGVPNEPFQCSDFLNYNGFSPISNIDYHEAVCSMFCNEWGSGIGSGMANAALSGIPNLDWEEATGPVMPDSTQGYYDPGGLCSLGCCEGLVNPNFGAPSESGIDVCNEPGNELDWGWGNYSQQEQDLICAMVDNGGSIEMELMGGTVTMTLPYMVGIYYNTCCPESAGIGQTDGMALLSKKLTKNDIDKLQSKLKKDNEKTQQLSKSNSQVDRMQKLANIKKRK